MTIFDRSPECAICTHRSPDVTVSLVRWKDPLPRAEWDAIARCKDREACRTRCRVLGLVYPVEDAVRRVA